MRQFELSKSDINVFVSANSNLALSKPTAQSSAFHPPSWAVNGNYDDFSHTNEGSGPKWWRADLGEIYSIGQMKLYNRKSCCRKLFCTTTLNYIFIVNFLLIK